MRIFARFYKFYLRVCVNVYFSYLMRLKRKFNIKSGLFGSLLYLYKKNTRAISARVFYTST